MRSDDPGSPGRGVGREAADGSPARPRAEVMPESEAGHAVSVILIVRNGERFIAEALTSVFASETRPTEVLVVDGGSTDRTAEIARGFPGTRVLAQAGTGTADAYNRGIALARGDLLAFISHDDVWAPGKLDRQVAFMRRHPTVGYTITMVQHFLHAGAEVPAGFRAELLDRPVPGFIMETLVARAATFRQVGLFDDRCGVSADTDWFARARDAGVPMALVPEVLLRKRVHGANSSLTAATINALLLRAMRGSVERKRHGQARHGV